PLCGIGVTSRIERICSPALASAWIADSRPEPGPCTRTCTRFTPRFTASRAACSAATVAANGVDFLDPLKPALPAEPQVIALPCMSLIVMSVLLSVAVMCATPSAATTFLARLAPAALAWAMLLLQKGFLFAGDRATRTLLGTRVRVRPLPAHWEVLAMARAAVGADVHQAFDVHRHFRPQRTFDLVVALDHLTQACDFGVTQVPHARIGADARLRQNPARVVLTDAEDVRKRVLNFLVAWQVHAGDTGHALPLPLLVFGTALTDDADDTAPPDHLAVLADRLDAGTHFHAKPPLEPRIVPGPLTHRKGRVYDDFSRVTAPSGSPPAATAHSRAESRERRS